MGRCRFCTVNAYCRLEALEYNQLVSLVSVLDSNILNLVVVVMACLLYASISFLLTTSSDHLQQSHPGGLRLPLPDVPHHHAHDPRHSDDPGAIPHHRPVARGEGGTVVLP